MWDSEDHPAFVCILRVGSGDASCNPKIAIWVCGVAVNACSPSLPWANQSLAAAPFFAASTLLFHPSQQFRVWKEAPNFISKHTRVARGQLGLASPCNRWIKMRWQRRDCKEMPHSGGTNAIAVPGSLSKASAKGAGSGVGGGGMQIHFGAAALAERRWTLFSPCCFSDHLNSPKK